MEPWPFSHGYKGRRVLNRMKRADLQWSHGPLAMDTRLNARKNKT